MIGQHTPGPWDVYAHPVAGPGDAILALVEQVQATGLVADNLYLINAGGKCPAITGCGPTSAANAAFVAAGPDMFDALVEAERVFRWYGDLHAAKPYADKAERNYVMADRIAAVLAKAGGVSA